ncbi:hypothetical protein MRX96_019356 [Rhipicephalus microplus]
MQEPGQANRKREHEDPTRSASERRRGAAPCAAYLRNTRGFDSRGWWRLLTYRRSARGAMVRACLDWVAGEGIHEWCFPGDFSAEWPLVDSSFPLELRGRLGGRDAWRVTRLQRVESRGFVASASVSCMRFPLEDTWEA